MRIKHSRTSSAITAICCFCLLQIANGGNIADHDLLRLGIKGTPRVIHYTKDDYNADSQFWGMCEDAEGILYFGNNDGILVFDGKRWQLIKLPNGSTVRSLRYASDGQVYVGGYNDLGRIVKNELGQYHFQSMKELLRPEDRNFEDIWQIHEAQGYIIFRSFKMLIAVVDNKATTLPADQLFTYSNVINDQLYIVDRKILKSVDLRTLEIEDIIKGKWLNEEDLISLLPGKNNEEHIAFTKQGSSFHVFPAQKKAVFFQQHLPANSIDQVFCALKSRSGVYYLGTINNQVIATELTDAPAIENRAFSNLQDNTVLNLFETKEGNIWALLNKGIDCIETSSPVSLIFDNAAIYDALMHNNHFYIATNQGVYKSALKKEGQYLSRKDFEIISGLEAQAWSMWLYEGKIVVAHDNGVFVLDGNRIYRLEGIMGVWKVIPVKGYPRTYLACAYTGLYVLEYSKEGIFTLKNKIAGFDISSRDIMQVSGSSTFWVCHGYKGVYKIKVDSPLTRTVGLEHYSNNNGLPSPYNINIFAWETDTVFTTNEGIYQFDAQSNRFVIHEALTNKLGEEVITRKILQHHDKTWFILDDELGYFYTGRKDSTLYKDLFLSLKGSFIKSMEFIMPVGASETSLVFVGTNNGLFSFDLSHEIPSKSVKALITQVTYQNEKDSLVYAPVASSSREPYTLKHNSSLLKFQLATPGFNAQTDVQYSYLLENMERSWSEWQNTSTKEYSYLKPGKYVFRVKSRSLLGEKSEEEAYHFEILPLWYQTKFAMVVFILLAMAIALLLAVWVRKKIEKTRREEQKLRKVLELELQQIKLEQEKEKIIQDKVLLEEDVIHKSKELANYTMLLVRKRDLLSEMKDELKLLKEEVKNDKTREKIRQLTKKINFNLEDEAHLQVFDANFERVHQDFFAELKSNYPDLSQKELRLCGFVKMNLTNKDIASILNISVRGVETARYRLRKRLSLDHEVNMAEFLEKLSSVSNESLEQEVDDEYLGR